MFMSAMLVVLFRKHLLAKSVANPEFPKLGFM